METTAADARVGDDAARPLSLAIPGPPRWTRSPSDLGTLAFSAAGEVRRPPVDEPPRRMWDLATALVRVTDDDGNAVGPWAPDVDAEVLRQGLRHMMLTRELDRRLLMDQRHGRTSFYMQSTGEEAVACGFAVALGKGDMNFPTYRQQGLLVAAGYPLTSMMGQVYSNELDPLHGRQMPVFYSARDHGFFSISGNLATQFVQAVGWAMASALQGGTSIAVGWIGDGATAESDFHAALVMASTYRAPVVLNIVNNQWAISTHESVARGGAATFAERGHGFGIPALRVDGNDFLAVCSAASWATERARRDLGPTLIEWVTYRAAAHSTSDDPSGYRPKDEPSQWPLGDPVDRLARHLVATGSWSARQQEALQQEVEQVVADAQAEAAAYGTLQSGQRPSARFMFEDVFARMPVHLRRQRQQAGF